ncbi:MAG: methionyl-tRNA formyltransferase [Desertimonas sp.]
MRLVYLGTPAMAVPPLHALVAAGHDVALVVTRPDKRRGRGSGVAPSPVKAAALALALPVSHDVEDVLEVDAELGVVVAFGRIIKPHVLAALPMVNVHFSLLPRWRGAAPVERALLAGDTETGVGIMAVAEGLDEGGVYAERTVPIGGRTTAAELRDELVTVGTELLVDTLDVPLGTPRAQVGEVTYAAKIDPAELAIDWARPAIELDRLVRLGGAWTTLRGKRLKVHGAEPVAEAVGAPGAIDGDIVTTGDGGLRLIDVQPEGKSAMPWSAFANGARPTEHDRLG